MICNKCGRNNPAGAEKCSFCKEPMPTTTNCGGFSDILTYTAPTVTDTVPLAPIEPAPVRNVIEAPSDEPWYADILSKKNIISLAAILLCVITLIVTIVSCSSGGGDKASQNPKDDKIEDKADSKIPEAQPQKLYKLKIGKKGILEEGLSLNFSDGKTDFLLCDHFDDFIDMFESGDDTYISEGTDTLSIESDKTYTILFFAAEEQFPLTLYCGKDKSSQLELTVKEGALDWSETKKTDEDSDGKSDEGSNDTSIPEWVSKPDSDKEKQGIFYAKDLTFPEGAKTARLVVKGGNSRDIDSKRVFVVGLDNESAKTENGIYTKEDFSNIKMIIINAKADSELAEGNEVKAPEFKKES